MLVFHSHCQLGNQMFIYACARSLSKKRGVPYCLSDTKELIKYFELSGQDKYLNTLKYQCFRIVNKLSPTSYTYHHLQDNTYTHQETLFKETSINAWYYGYFQSENFFSEIKAEIKTLFEIKSIHKKRYNNVLNTLPTGKKTLAIHIRLKDYKTFGPEYLNGPDMTLPYSYYHQLLRSFDLEKYQIVFLSDDILSVKNEFKNIENAYFSQNDPIIDFQFIKNADIALISHSTFAWWAAWLNEKSDKQIFAPEYFLGFKIKKEYPVNIIPNGWKKITVY